MSCTITILLSSDIKWNFTAFWEALTYYGNLLKKLLVGFQKIRENEHCFIFHSFLYCKVLLIMGKMAAEGKGIKIKNTKRRKCTLQWIHRCIFDTISSSLTFHLLPSLWEQDHQSMLPGYACISPYPLNIYRLYKI